MHSHLIFNGVADVLVECNVDDDTKHGVLAALMDGIGVPVMSFERYLGEPGIVRLFNERGVRLATPEERAGATDG